MIQKKNKGISLIVLIITVVVIIILGTAIIVNIAKTNIIDNANEAVVKQDFKTFQDELTLYAADRYTQTKGKFEIEKLNADSTSITYTGEGTLTESNVYDILTSLEKSKYKEYVIIKDGKIAILDSMSEKEKKWAKQAIGEIEVVEEPEENEPESPDEPEVETPEQKNDETAPTVPTNLELTVKGNEITAVASGSTDENEITYEYSLDGTTWQETGVFQGLDTKTKYTIYARAKDKTGNISEIIKKEETTKYSTSAVNTKVENRNATITGENPSYDNPVIPVGFKAIETTDASWTDSDNDGKPDGWNDGLVIQDDNLNEFVWVPCTLDGKDGSIKYVKNYTYPSWYSNPSEKNTTDDTSALPMKDETTRITETEQISKYGGFYIGRYEAGVPANQTAIDGKSKASSDKAGIPVVKQGAIVWTQVSYSCAMPNCKKIYETNTSVKSGILTGRQWDTVCAWINSENDPQGKVIHNVLDGRNWGNYSDSINPANVSGYGKKQVAGFNDYWKTKNIYDFAGNTWEWTAEDYAACKIFRGGGYDRGGLNYPTAYRDYNPPAYPYDFVSFRVVLYVL